MKLRDPVSLGRLGAAGAMVAMALMPFMVMVAGFHITGASLERTDQADREGMIVLYIIPPLLLHLLLALPLWAYFRRLSRRDTGRIRVLLVAIFSLLLSGVYYAGWLTDIPGLAFVRFPYVRYGPMMLHVFVFTPLLVAGSVSS